MLSIRTRVRLAQRLHDAWRSGRQGRNDFEFHWGTASRVWSHLVAIQDRLRRAQEKNYRYCLASLDEDYRWRLSEVARALQSLQELPQPVSREPGLGEWMQELQTLEEEFGGFTVAPRTLVLKVATEAITLKDVELGAFSIEFHWSRLAHQQGSSCFDIVALDPNPPSGREDVTHPHVNDQELCAGDASYSIGRALSEGRLGDAFVLIRSVLTTYNPRSAYVQLSEWDGTTCGDCGGRVVRENSSYCSACQSDLCEGCSSYCRSCEETRCGNCLTSCDDCQDSCCSRCLESVALGQSLCSSCRAVCDRCSTLIRSSDLKDDSLCPACAEADATPPPPIMEETHAS